jgi:hypothetical protein
VIDSSPQREEITIKMKAEIHTTLHKICLSCL